MKNLIFIILLTLLSFTINLQAQQDFAKYVNPFIGTDFHGHTFPGAILPFGMVQLSPDTRLDGWDGCSAYHYSDSIVYGFSHTHLSGTGCSDYGDVLMMPFTGKGSVINTEYASVFSHDNEIAIPGYYSVLLDKNNIHVELTTSKRVGVHRYTYPNTPVEKGFVLDLKHRDPVLYSMIHYDAETNSIHGTRNSRAWNEDQKLAFSLLLSKPVRKVELYLNDVLVPNVNKIEGTNCKALIYFDDDIKEIVAKVAISANTEEPNAALKNHIEVKDFNFDRVKSEAYDVWNKELGKIAVETEEIELKKIFYTALYHAFTAPNLFTDVDGSYLGLDQKIHKVTEGRTVYTVFSLWDTYRALHPLLNLIDRERTEDFLYTFMRHYEQGGMLPIWELAGFETWCMIGYHSVPVIYDAFVKGIGGYDKEKMLEAMIHSATLDKLGRPEYAKYGYVPAHLEHESVSKTLEYAYDDWCIAQFAKAIGNEEVYQEYIKRSQYYKNIFDPDGFMRPKFNGAWIVPFDPTEVNNHFTEGNSWQYSTYIPHDFTNYIALRGGDAIVEQFLDSLFYTSARLSGRHQVDVTGLIGQYAHGNEPSHHATYLYNYVGKPWKTQELTRKIMSELYTSAPDGLCGNEDCGQMSAWYVFSALGFYPVCPGDNQYVLGSPIFDKATMNLENGKQFNIIAHNQSDKNIYIQSVKLNGKPYSKSYITYNDIKDGGTLEFVMGNQPNMVFGTEIADRPKNEVESTLTMVPVFEPMQRSFKGSTTVSLSLYEPKEHSNNYAFPTQTDKIFYRIYDENNLSSETFEYEGPFTIDKSVTIVAIAWNAETGASNVAEANYYKFQKDKSIQILSKYSSQYTADGDEGLIDYIRGNVNFRLGGWQGYQAQDFEAIVDLESVQEVNEIGAGFLQDIRSWIFFPTSMIVETSVDGIHYVPYGTFVNPHPDDDYTAIVDDFMIKKEATARFVKVKAMNYGNLPEWHLGAGYPAFIFIDEIIVK
ncbi:MAG: GH92 family glycosyl hydrolase [Bacteroidetes bacterium]|nr:GH92 family glycosyl hydrolase [Bacteroidota bacterium]MCL2302179.1 GH92 family glycosyl hydrolase [Lentimicrobiaceae bacterium]